MIVARERNVLRPLQPSYLFSTTGRFSEFCRKNRWFLQSLRSVILHHDVAQISASRASPSTSRFSEDNERACEFRGLFHNTLYLDAWINIDHSYAEKEILFSYTAGTPWRASGRAAGRRQCHRNPITPVLCVRPGEEPIPGDFSRRMQRPSLLHRHSQPAVSSAVAQRSGFGSRSNRGAQFKKKELT